jgi:hypothetical protein
MRICPAGLSFPEILNQAGKITIMPVTQGLRPELEITHLRDKNHHQMHACFLSKKAIFLKNSSNIASSIIRAQYWPLT